MGSTARRWRYKTDEAGRPRRFFSYREAAWWATLKTGKIAGPVLLYAFLRRFFVSAGPGVPLAEKAAFFLVPTALLLLWVLAIGVVCLYLGLSGGVIDRDERRRFRGNSDGGGRA